MTEATAVTETRFGPPPPERPVVSVLMITYNHERFIREAIESVFMQEVDFPIELVIGEDCSTDDTRAVIEAVCRHAPIPVRLLTSAANVGMHENFKRTLLSCTGEYVAMLEGDDEWSRPWKIRSQVAVLESEVELSMVFGRCQIVNLTGEDKRFGPTGAVLPTGPSRRLSLVDLITFEDLVPTATVMVRRSALPAMPDWADRLPWGDSTLWLLCALKGDVLLIDDCLALYKVGAGVSSRFDPVERRRALIELQLRICCLASKVRAAQIFDALDQKLRHGISSLERERGLAFVSGLLRLRVMAGLRAGRFRAAELSWWLRSVVAGVSQAAGKDG